MLVHGTGGNKAYLVDRGYCVFSLDHGRRAGVPLAYGLGPVEESALGATGADEVDLVGHSQGGMMPRQYLKFLGGAEKVNALVGIAPQQPRRNALRSRRNHRSAAAGR